MISVRRRRTRKEFLGTLALVSGAALLFPSSAIVVRRTPRGRAIPGATNALERQTLGMYSAWFAWLNRAGVPGYLGETNTPNVEKPWPQSQVDLWLTLLDKVYATIDEAGPTIAGVTAHVASITESGGGGFKVYGPDRSDVPLSQRNFSEVFQQASVIEAHPPTPDSMRGMNTSAGAMTPDTFGPSNPGTYATDYVYPDGSDYEYLLSRGHNLTRVPFRWERVQVRDARQPSSNPALKAAEIARLAASFDAAASVGMNVIPSVQNYGAYVFSTSIFGTENLGKIGSSKLPISAYAAFMKQLAAAFAGHPAVAGLDIMNEPRQLSGSPPARTWEQASQAAVEAIREISTTLKLWIAGYHTPPSGSYPGLYSFIANHPEPWIVAENFGYTSHCYYGPGSGYPNSYDEAVALWEVKGY